MVPHKHTVVAKDTESIVRPLGMGRDVRACYVFLWAGTRLFFLLCKDDTLCRVA